MKKVLTTLCLCVGVVSNLVAQDEHIVIWNNDTAPTSSELWGDTYIEKGVFEANNNVAELFIYYADAKHNTGKAVVVCPGGGYHNLAIGYEGHDMARWFASQGVTAAVLKYRMPNGHPEVPRNDAERALQIMRSKADTLGFNPSQVGIVGSSAGGHLAASTGTLSDVKPAFMILLYPVITAREGQSHRRSFECLLGKNFTPEQARNYSLEKRVSRQTPSTLLLLSDDDTIVPTLSSVLFYEALKANGVKASMHIFPSGDHGWGIKSTFKYYDEWRQIAMDWLKQL